MAKDFGGNRSPLVYTLRAAWLNALLNPSSENPAVKYILAEGERDPHGYRGPTDMPWVLNLAAEQAGWLVDRLVLSTAEFQLQRRNEGQPVEPNPRLIENLTKLREYVEVARKALRPPRVRFANEIDSVDKLDLGDTPCADSSSISSRR
ncbi:hypothetical protein [Nannocystis pusilla]|uniref:hypothetical protein n=1 Tax=Nannocystis pusilla TaxID=889268 RepID=UPI003B7B0161